MAGVGGDFRAPANRGTTKSHAAARSEPTARIPGSHPDVHYHDPERTRQARRVPQVAKGRGQMARLSSPSAQTGPRSQSACARNESAWPGGIVGGCAKKVRRANQAAEVASIQGAVGGRVAGSWTGS